MHHLRLVSFAHATSMPSLALAISAWKPAAERILSKDTCPFPNCRLHFGPNGWLPRTIRCCSMACAAHASTHLQVRMMHREKCLSGKCYTHIHLCKSLQQSNDVASHSLWQLHAPIAAQGSKGDVLAAARKGQNYQKRKATDTAVQAGGAISNKYLTHSWHSGVAHDRSNRYWYCQHSR